MNINLHKPLLKSEKIKSGTDSPVLATAYTYNKYDLANTKTLTGSDEKETSITTIYACDTVGELYDTMKNLNLVSYPIEIITRKDGIEIAREKNEYTSNGKNVAAKYASWGKNPLQKIISYNRYDLRGHLLQSTTPDEIVRSYVWRDTYDLLPVPEPERQSIHYPIAEIFNEDYDTVDQIIQNSLKISSSPINKYIDCTKIDTLRKALPNAQVTTYTYKPLVGIATITDPRGIVTHYDYDSFGRLKETYYYENNDKSKKRKVESYDYHYKN